MPSHYAHMARRNRRGAWTPRPGTRLDADQVGDALARGAHVVDLRSSEAYAAGHLPGSLAVPAGAAVRGVRRLGHALGSASSCSSRTPTVELEATERELAGVGIEAVETAVLDADARRGAAAFRRTDWTGFASDAPGADAVVLDVRRPRRVARTDTSPAPSTSPCTSCPRRLDEIPPGEVWVHCAAGYRATVAAGLLDRAGRDVVLVDDDFARVRRARNPLAAWAIRRLTGCTTPDM